MLVGLFIFLIFKYIIDLVSYLGLIFNYIFKVWFLYLKLLIYISLLWFSFFFDVKRWGLKK